MKSSKIYAIHNSPATYDTECFHDQCFNSDNTIMIIQWRILHHPTTLYSIDLTNNHSLMRLADYGCSLKWLCFETGLILLFFRVFSGNHVTVGFDIRLYTSQCSYPKFPKSWLWSFFIWAPQFCTKSDNFHWFLNGAMYAKY